jgi:hypothetical protein
LGRDDLAVALMMDLKAFETMLEQGLETVVPRLEIGLEKVGQLAESIAAELPGHYQPGWAPLAESTLKDKAAKGFPVPSPLKRTGKMAGSYKKEVLLSELALVIGSEDKVALFQEMGTSRIPPRPVLHLALQRSLPFAADVFGEVAMSLMTGKALLK